MICANYIEFHFENVYTECIRKKERGKYTVYLKRKVDTFLREWKADPARKPLIIKGSRQVGKTESIRKFAAEDYESVVEINFVRDEKYKGIIADGYEAAAIIKNISMIDPSKKFIPHKTLLFFDEITEFPEIATSLKFFHEDGRFDVICSGSMLGVNYKKIESNSVGYKKDYDMFSMDFEEFLWAKGYDDTTVEDMLLHMRELRPFNELEMQVYHSLFLDFCILGGMPAVVAEYIEKNTFEGSLDTQRQFSKVATGARFRDYRGCAEWLADAGMVNICFCLEFPELPLGGNYDPDVFKLYFADTGLLVSMLDEESQEDLRANKNLGVYKGALYENMVGEALVKQGYKLYYYKRSDSTLEEDFFIRSSSSLIPLEVKAKNGQAKSMRTLIASDKYEDIRYGFKLSAGNIGHEEHFYTFPYFCAFLLKRFMKDFRPQEENCD